MGACSSKTPSRSAERRLTTDREPLLSSEKGNEQSVKLLKRSIDVDARDENDAALLLAAETARRRAGTLIKAGAAGGDSSAGASTPRRRRQGRGRREATAGRRVAEERGPRRPRPFWAACATRDTKIAARLLQAGADVDEQDNNGITALGYAVATARRRRGLRARGAAEVDERLSMSCRQRCGRARTRRRGAPAGLGVVGRLAVMLFFGQTSPQGSVNRMQGRCGAGRRGGTSLASAAWTRRHLISYTCGITY